jgi:hypothetical protein
MTTTPSSEHQSVLAQVTALASLDRPQLRERWTALFGGEPPGYGPDLLRRRLAYRIQELAYGGLAEATRQRLREIDAQAQNARKGRDPSIPVPGTILIKEWGGERHEVAILEDGFQYRGQRHASLSSIARLITGTNWNGLRFFGLRSQTKGAA